jgi:hypothetical protein
MLSCLLAATCTKAFNHIKVTFGEVVSGDILFDLQDKMRKLLIFCDFLNVVSLDVWR